MKTAAHWIQYLLFLFASALLLLLPFRFVQRIGGWLGEFSYAVLGFRKGVTLENLRYAFPDESAEYHDRIARKAFRNIGSTLIELLWYPRMSKEMIKELVSVEDVSLLRECHRSRKGFILLTAHFGSWEILPQAILACAEVPVTVLYKKQSNPFIDRAIEKRRSKYGNTMVPLGLAVRELLRSLHDGRGILMAADQSAPKESIWLDFFGRSIPVFQGPALLSLKTRVPLILTFLSREDNGRYRLTCREIQAADLADTNESAVELTRRHLRETEEVIRKHPDQWMWMHRRWKHAVPADAEKEGES